MSTINTTINHGVTLGSTYVSPLTITATGAINNNGSGNAIFGGGATVVNYGGITATGTNPGIGAGYPGVYLGSGSLDNHGTITAKGDGAEFQATGDVTNYGLLYGGRWGVTSRGLFTVTNTGAISGASQGIVLFAGGQITNSNLIQGSDGVGISGAVGTVINTGTGTISGTYGNAIQLSSGGTVSNTGTGLISAGGAYAAISISGGAGRVVNSATISGYLGVQFIGTYNNTLIDTGTIIGSGGTAVAFGSGNDLLQFSGTAAQIQGTVDGGGGTNTLEFTSGASTGTLTGVGAVFTNFAQGTVDAGANWVLTGSNTFGSSVTLTDSGTLTVAGVLTNNGSIAVDPPVTVAGTFVNAGTLSATVNGYLVQLAPGGYFLNTTAGALARYTGNGYSPAIYGETGGISRVVNLGTVSNSHFDVGVKLEAGGTITNGATNATSALIYGGFPVLILGASGTVNNYGTLRAVPTFDGVGVSLDAGGVVNNGITGSTVALIAGDDYGVKLGGGTVDNFGTIGGHTGIYATSAIATVLDNGTIIGDAGYGVVLDAGGTIIDAGSISGSTAAVAFNGTNAGLLILEHGYSLHGVRGSTSASATVELLGTSAANAVTATYNGLGLTNVGTIAFAPGTSNYATLKISNDATLPGTITDFTGAHDTIDLTTLAFVSGSSTATLNTASDQLTVSNGATSVTLQLGSGTYSGISFTAVSDGASGTDILATTAVTTGFTIHNETELNAAIQSISTGGVDFAADTDFTLTLANGFTLTSAVSAVALDSGSALTINGGGFTLNGGAGAYGFLTDTGAVTVQNLTIANAQATVSSGATWTLAGQIASGGTLTNSGMLTGGGTLMVNGNLTNTETILFNGTTSGDAIQLRLASGASLTNLSGATIGFVNADYQAVMPIIYGAGGPATVTNLGTIRHGEVGVSLQSGGRVVNGATNDTTALIATYDGILSSNTGSLTVANYGTISSGHIGAGMGGTGVVINGATNATAALLTGEDGVTFYGRAGTVINFGVIVGTTHGSVIFTDGVFMGYGSGGTVIDTGTIMGSRYAVDFETSPTPGRYGSDGNNRLKLYAGADLVGRVTAAGTSNVLELASGTGTGTINGIGTSFLGLGTITVDAGASWVLTGYNTLGAGYTLIDAGTLTNIGTLVVDPPITVTGTFINGSIVSATGGNDAIYVANGGVVTNTEGGTISGGTVAITAAGTATIDNFGIVAATSTFAAIAMASGTVINGSASNTTAAILGSTYGIEATGVATVVNYSTVTANHQEGIGLRAGGSLDNLGVIDANEYGVFLYGPGTATNSGTITGLGGIVTNYDADVVVNSGDITGTRGGGIILQAGGTVIDSGTISGSYVAVLFRGTVNNLLVLENGYKLSGPVGGSASASSNVVELLGTSAANAVTANYNGLDLTRIGTIAFAPTSTNYATLRITNDATLPGTIAGFIGPHDTIDLTALSDTGNDATTSFNTLTDMLTVTGDNGTVNLQLDNEDYAGVTWLTHNDGSGGTEVTPEVGGSASLTGTLANIGVPDEMPSTPFSALTVTDPTEGATDTVTITLSNPAFGTLSDLDGGGYDAATGVYTVSGTPGAVTTAIDQLVLTPAPPASNVYVTSTALTVEAQGPVGGPATTSAIAASVQQILGLATVPSSQIAISVSADGTGFAAPIVGKTNEAVVTAPTTGGTYVLPAGYQAEFLGGNGNATLQDFSVSDSVTVPNANPSLLVSNTGNDVLNGLTTNDTIFASSGNDTLSAGASAVLLAGDGNDSISAYDTLGTYLITVGSGIDTIRIAGFGTVTGGTGTDLIDASTSSSSDSVQIALQGTHDTLLGGAGDATVASAGTDGLVLAGTGALSDDDTGHHDTIDAASAASAAVTTGANAALVVGGSNALSVLDQGFQDSVSAGGGATSVTTGGSQAQVLGGAGALSVLDSGLHDIIQAGSGPTSATLAGSDVIIKASTGSLSVLDQTANNTIVGGSGTSLFAVTIAAAGADVFGRAGPFDALDSASGALIGTGNGSANVTIAGSNAAVWGGSGTLALSIGGSNAVVGVGADAATIDASAAGATNATVYGGYSNTPGLDGAAVVTGGANALLVATGGSNTTINAGSGSDSVYIGTGSIAGSNLINGGGGPLLVAFAGGAGSATVFGGSGQTSLFGTAGTDALYQGSSTGALLYANGTNASSETLSAASSTSNDTLFSGHGNVSLVAGSGNDWLIAGDNTGSLGGAGSVVGGSTMVGGSGQDLFIFASSFSDGADVISNFSASDTVYLSGYDTLAGGAANSDTQAMHALQDATVSGGNTTIALADGTSITFVDTTTAQLQGHVFST